MGNFYVNVTLKGPGRDQIAAGLAEAGCDAYLSPTVDGVTTICEAVCDSQDDDHIRAFAAKRSERLSCPALAVLTGSIRSFIDGTLRCFTPTGLQKQLFTFSPAKPAY